MDKGESKGLLYTCLYIRVSEPRDFKMVSEAKREGTGQVDKL